MPTSRTRSRAWTSAGSALSRRRRRSRCSSAAPTHRTGLSSSPPPAHSGHARSRPRGSASRSGSGRRSRSLTFDVMAKKLAEYEAKRDFKKTPEPGARVPKQAARAPRFVVQENHARRLHWDFRLEKDGVGVSWAVPKGIPPDPKQNHLAVHVEDHPLEYFKFAGEIPKGEYGGGQVLIWDEGTYGPVKWSDGEVMVDLHGKRLEGRYVLFSQRGNDWMIHRMDPPQDPDRQPMPDRIEPMMAKLGTGIPSPDSAWGFEFKWDGIRALAYVEGGIVRLISRSGEVVTPRYPEVHAMG